MSEQTLAQVAAAALPVVEHEVASALVPDAQAVLADLHGFVSGEADKLRQELPAAVDQGVAHLHALGEAILGRYHTVMAYIEARLNGAPAALTPTPAVVSSDASTSSTPIVVGEPGPEAPAPTADGTDTPAA